MEHGYTLDRKTNQIKESHEISQLPVAPALPRVAQSDDSPANYGYDVPTNPTTKRLYDHPKSQGMIISVNASSSEQLVKSHQPEIGNVNEAYDYPRKVSDITRQFERKVATSENYPVSHGATTDRQPPEAQGSYEAMIIAEDDSDQIYENFDRKDDDSNKDYYNVNEIRGSSHDYYNQGQDDDEIYCNDAAPIGDEQGNYEEMTGRG